MACFVVTGGAGFIGSHLVDALLAAGHWVRVVDNLSSGRRENLSPRAELMVGDVGDRMLMRAAMRGAEACFHLAAVASVARSNEEWTGTHRCNQGGTIVVLEAARDAGAVPVVYASSAAVYGEHCGKILHEGLMPQPLSAYGADKLGSELHARVAFHVHGVPTLGLRFFNVYGPRQDPRSPYSGVISIFAEAIANRRVVTVNGDGMQTRDFVFVEDVIDHLTAGMDRLRHRPEASVFNVCTGRATSIMRLVETLGAVVGRRADIVFAPARPGDVRASLGCPQAARAALGRATRSSLADGLACLLADSAPVLKLAG
jgi:UDP-glucose 4-epimerase